MSPFFDDLERQLHDAARARTGGAPAPSARAPRRRNRWLGALPAVAAVVVALLVAGGALLAFGHRARQTPTRTAASLADIPAPRLRRELAYIQAATRQLRTSAVCRTHPQRGPSVIHGSPAPALLAVLGVLRRPAGPADRLGAGSIGQSETYAGFVRRAFVSHGTAYYVAAGHQDFSGSFPSARCLALASAAERAYAPRIPSGLRAQTLAVAAQQMAYERKLAAQRPQDVVCFVSASRNGGASQCGLTVAALRRGVSPTNAQGTFSGIVPDGVASVTVRFPATGGRPALSATAAVTGNVYAVRIPQLAGAGFVEPTVVWRSAAGRVIKTVVPLSRAAAERLCRASPVACLSLSEAVSGGGYAESSSSSSASGTTPATPPSTGGPSSSSASASTS
jgi:hypothetical protein